MDCHTSLQRCGCQARVPNQVVLCGHIRSVGEAFLCRNLNPVLRHLVREPGPKSRRVVRIWGWSGYGVYNPRSVWCSDRYMWRFGDPLIRTTPIFGPRPKLQNRLPASLGVRSGYGGGPDVGVVWMWGWPDRATMQHCFFRGPSPNVELPGIVQPQSLAKKCFFTGGGGIFLRPHNT